MTTTKAQREQARKNKKKEISDALDKARENVNNATTGNDVDAAVAEAEKAANSALQLATEAFKKATAPNHTSEDEDVQVELGDFAMQAQIAAQSVRTAGDKRKASSGW